VGASPRYRSFPGQGGGEAGQVRDHAGRLRSDGESGVAPAVSRTWHRHPSPDDTGAVQGGQGDRDGVVLVISKQGPWPGR
jgi:hypothetical protein